jgi:exopolysaccharide biosynthesis polyprenyl glycosylphosphotransferase
MSFLKLPDANLVELTTVRIPRAKPAPRGGLRFATIAGILEPFADLVTVAAGVLVAHWVYAAFFATAHIHYCGIDIVAVSLVFGALFVFLLDHAGIYNSGNSLLQIRETERVLRVSVQAVALALLVTFFFSPIYSRWTIAFAFVFVPTLLLVQRQLALQFMRYLHRHGYGVRNVLIYGAGNNARHVFSALVRSAKTGLNPIAVIDEDLGRAGQRIYEYGYGRERSAPVISGPLTSRLLRESGASLVVVAVESLTPEVLERIAAEARAAHINVAYAPQPSPDSHLLHRYLEIDGVMIGPLDAVTPRFWYEALKRAFDFVMAVINIALIAPACSVVVFLIRRDSSGPVFFHQERVGHHGKTFRVYKFRSMRTDAPKYAKHPDGADDPRITRVGRWLRRTSIDELPQLLNVLKGDMSLVGPRPEMPFLVEQHKEQHRQRLAVRPGITGLWQLSADRMFQIHENIYYDLYYVRHRNFFMDISILLHTVVYAMRGV